MFTDTIQAVLDKPLIARMTTLDPDGYPHTVPVWFMRDGDDLVVISFRNTHKVRNIQRNPKGSLVIGGDPADSPGYLFKGDFVIVEDSDRSWTRALTLRYESGEQAVKDIADWSKQDMILIRMKPKSVAKVI